ELFSVRRSLYTPVEPDTLLDDFIISLRVASQGYRVAYAPDAFASERPSADTSAEMKRKVRISAGGLQSIVRLRHLLNPFGQFRLWFQYVSHRVLRWTLAPLMLPMLLLFNLLLVFFTDPAAYSLPAASYELLLAIQIVFYSLAFGGYLLEKKKMRAKLLFVPFYFTFMNISVFMGLRRFLKGSQTVIWERAERAK
ncbi:MAG: glycosyltransferase family 2 protein, partial [Cyclonatronaceae bacterium]